MSDEKVIPVKVALRTRPLIQREIDENAKECLAFIKDAQQVVVNANKAFTFDYVFDPKTGQDVVYQASVAPLIEGIFKGYNGTVLAYGQTGSGKTYSMGSAHCVSQTSLVDDTSGVIPRVITDLFSGISQRTTHEFLVKVSYAEIYKEEVKDLLAAADARQVPLSIRENVDGSIRIAGLTERIVSSPSETLELMEKGNSARSTGCTAMNATSSRSHAIFTIVLESRSLQDADEYTCSKFHLVDLAGSERAKRTKAKGERLQEGIKINSGLLALGNVISALGDERQRDQHVPYRVSKLTRILQDSLGGNSLTVMIACVSPADSNAEETLNTLRYADRARKIKNKAVVNRDPQTAELVSLRKEVQQLRIKLLQTTGSTSSSPESSSSSESKERVRKLEEEKRQLVAEMQSLVNNNTEMCEKAITTDLLREHLQSQLSELKSEAEKVVDDPHDLSLAEQALDEEQQRDCVHKLRALRDNIIAVKLCGDSPADIVNDLTTIAQNLEQDSINGDEAISTSINEGVPHNESMKAEHLMRTVKLSNQLQELSKALAMKEDLAKKMGASEEHMGALKSQYEEKLAKLDSEISGLQKEKDALVAALEVAVNNKDAKQISERRRQRLLELETQIKELKQEKKEKEKVSKLKAQGDQKINKLHGEIQQMKSVRVKLMKQIKEENQKFQAMKKDKERQVKQLKEKDRKRQFEIVKLERDFSKQKNVLRRKTEEAAASNRRLKEALLKQKLAATKRQQTQARSLDGANTKMRSWLEEDIEIAVRSREARNHLESLEEELKDLKKQLNKMEDTESPSKRRRTYLKSECDEMQRQRQAIEDEAELKEAQVKELRSKLSDAKDSRVRQQARMMQITSIAEARSIMKHLFGLIVSSRISEEERTESSRRTEDEKRSLEERVGALEEELEKVGREKEENMTALESSYHEQMLFLTSQLNQSTLNRTVVNPSQRENDLQSQIKIQADVITKLLKQEEKGNLFQPLDATFQKPKQPKKQKKSTKRPLTAEELAYMEEDSDEISDYDSESDYMPTPIVVRKRSMTKPCACAKSNCSKKICVCVKNGRRCTERCGCGEERCVNRHHQDENGHSDENNENNGSTIRQQKDDSDENNENNDDIPPLLGGTPYYKRKNTLFESDISAETTPVSSQEKGDVGLGEVGYRSVYFPSPLPLGEHNSDPPLSDKPLNTPPLPLGDKPLNTSDCSKGLKRNVGRKRRLANSPHAMLA